jgi:hypothetical protein
VLTLDRSVAAEFWLAREYLPRAHDLWGSFEETLANLGACEVVDVPVPDDCVDGFFHAFWKRPDAYLDDSIRETMAVFNQLDKHEVATGLGRLSYDLAAGRWADRHANLLALESLDVGYRLLVHEL